MSEAEAFIRRSDALYRALAARARRDQASGRSQRSARGAQNAARLACFAHSGRFADGRLENMLLEIARQSVTTSGARPARGSGPERVLHVATRVLPTGGHTRLLANWIRLDRARHVSRVVPDLNCPVHTSQPDTGYGLSHAAADARQPESRCASSQ